MTQALLDEGHRALGLCNVAIGFQRRFAAHFDVAPERVQLEHVGLNHLTWERKVLVDGVDRLPEILDTRDRPASPTRRDMPAELIREIGAIPSYYLHYYYLTERVLEQQRTGKTRAEEVMEIEAGLLELYKDPALDTKPKLLEERGGAFYSDAAAALVASLHAGTNDVQVVNMRNDGADRRTCPDDAVVEVAARVDRDGAHPLPVDPLPPEMLGLVEHAKAYELLTAQGGDVRRPRGCAEGAHDEPARRRLRHGQAAARTRSWTRTDAPAAVLPRRADLRSRYPFGSSSACRWTFATASTASSMPLRRRRGTTFSMK